MDLPKYIDCKNNTTSCDYFVTGYCLNTCPYAKDVKGVGVGAMDLETVKRLEKEV